MSSWRAQLFFAGPEIKDPSKVPLQLASVEVRVPGHIGIFETTALGLRIRDAGTEIPARCTPTPELTNEVVTVGPDWRYFWRPMGASDWVYCGLVGK